jgi:hypothetical protein
MKPQRKDVLCTVEELLHGRPPLVREYVEALRRIVRSAAPKAKEVAYRGWRVIAYVGDSTFCYIAPLRNGANLGFHQGVSLPDPNRLLEGTGKNLRHVKIRSPKDLRAVVLKALVRQAYRVQSVAAREA